MTKEQLLADIDRQRKSIYEAQWRLMELITDYVAEHARFKEGEVVRFRLDGQDANKVGIVKDITVVEGDIVYVLIPVLKDGSKHPWIKCWREEKDVQKAED